MKRNFLVITQIQRYMYNATRPFVTKTSTITVLPERTSSSQIFSNICWKCGAEARGSLFCKKCNTIQRPQEKNNYFKVLGIHEQFDIDQKLLRNKFKMFQSLIHPDKFSTSTHEEQTISEEYSSLINKAYSNLLTPLKRAEHLLQLNGESIAESQTIDEPAFLMKIMTLNEEVEDSEQDIEKLSEINDKNKNEMEKLVQEIDSHFRNHDIEAAKKAIIKLKYFFSVNNRINSIFREAGVTD